MMHLILATITAVTMLSTSAFSQEFFDPLTAAAMAASGDAVIVDVQEANEIAEGMAAPARWFPTSKIRAGGPEFEAFMQTLDIDQTVIVYCRTGRRAAYFVSILEDRGYVAENMGGLSNWIDAGLPVIIP